MFIEQELRKKNIAEYPLVKKILEEFKGSKIETVIRKNLVENETEISEVTSTEIEEEE